MSKPAAPNSPISPANLEKLFIPRLGLLTKIGEVFGISRAVALGAILLTGLVVVVAVFFFVHSAPSDTITITAGPEGSIFYTNAVKYSTILARQGVRLRILTSEGSLDNLQRLNNPKFKADVGFVQDGLGTGPNDKLVSLGSISYQPLLVFYRGAEVSSLAALAGKKIVVGPVGSGTRNLVLTLLDANGIDPGGPTTLLDWGADQSSQALQDGKVDAVFLMGEDVSVTILRQLLRTPGVHLASFSQAEAYTRKFSWLSVLKLPEGSLDLGKNIPQQDVYLIGPTVELVARKGLHPALSDLLLEAAQEVHGDASLLQRKGEFPAPMEHDFRISADAARFYRSGKSFFYHYLPFWLASLTSRIVVVFIPTVVVMIPVLRSIPTIYRWRIQSQIYRWYRALLAVERDLMLEEPTAESRRELLERLDANEQAVNKMRISAFFAEQFYALRGHIDFVRQLMMGRQLPH